MIKFIEDNFTIIDPRKGNTRLKLYGWQKEIIKIINKNKTTILVTSRQIGSSTILNAYALCFAMHTPNVYVLVVGSKLNTAYSFCSEIKHWYEETAFHQKPEAIHYEKSRIMFENGSSINFTYPGIDAVKGHSCDLIICHDFAFYNDSDKLMASLYPCLVNSKYKKLILQSSPNGVNNTFYTMSHSNHLVKKYDWKSNPTITWTEEEVTKIKNEIGERRFKQEFECAFEEYEEKNELINIRVTNIEKEKMLIKAKNLGFQSLSEYLRFVGLNANIKVEL